MVVMVVVVVVMVVVVMVVVVVVAVVVLVIGSKVVQKTLQQASPSFAICQGSCRWCLSQPCFVGHGRVYVAGRNHYGQLALGH